MVWEKLEEIRIHYEPFKQAQVVVHMAAYLNPQGIFTTIKVGLKSDCNQPLWGPATPEPFHYGPERG